MPPMRERETGNGERLITRIVWGRKRAELVEPYRLSFASLSAFETVWVRVEDSAGGTGLGEAVALPGYAWETVEDIANTVSALVEGAVGVTVARQEARCRAICRDHPFAASAMMTALDLPDLLVGHHRDFSFPLNVPVSGQTPVNTLDRQVHRHLETGYRFIKVKIGCDIAAESAAARLLLAGDFERPFQVVFDANQAYSTEQALHFATVLAELPKERLAWLEQPVAREDWSAMAVVCRQARVPVVLDEAIYDEADIERAAAIGAYGVKLKLFKNFGPRGTLDLARRARKCGLMAVFGNGVATDIGNLAEMLVLEAGSGLFSPPGECSGFIKLKAPLLSSALKITQEGQIYSPLSSNSLIDLITKAELLETSEEIIGNFT